MALTNTQKQAAKAFVQEWSGKGYEKGEWKEISCNTEVIADKYVPEKILSTISKRWPSAEVRKIERYRQGYELELSNRIELKFNKQCKLVEIDD